MLVKKIFHICNHCRFSSDNISNNCILVITVRIFQCELWRWKVREMYSFSIVFFSFKHFLTQSDQNLRFISYITMENLSDCSVTVSLIFNEKIKKQTRKHVVLFFHSDRKTPTYQTYINGLNIKKTHAHLTFILTLRRLSKIDETRCQ